MLGLAGALATVLIAYGDFLPNGLPALVLECITLLVMWMVARKGLYVNSRDVRIQGMLRSQRIPWADIDGVDEGPRGRRATDELTLRTIDGRYVPATVQQTIDSDRYGPFVTKRPYVRLVAYLNARAAGARRGPERAAPGQPIGP